MRRIQKIPLKKRRWSWPGRLVFGLGIESEPQTVRQAAERLDRHGYQGIVRDPAQSNGSA